MAKQNKDTPSLIANNPIGKKVTHPLGPELVVVGHRWPRAGIRGSAWMPSIPSQLAGLEVEYLDKNGVIHQMTLNQWDAKARGFD